LDNYRRKAIIYLLAAAVLWSMSGLFIKLISWNPLAIAGGRSGIAAVVMLIYLKLPFFNIKDAKPASVKTRLGLSRIKLLGAFSYAALVILFVAANKLTTSANAILLQFTSPIWVALLSGWFLKERVRKSDWAAIAAVMVGMTLFFVGDLKSGNTLGNILAVLSGIIMAVFTILLKLQDEGSPVEMTLLGNIITLAAAVPFFFSSVPDLKSILCILVMGVFQLGISYILYATSVRYVSALEAILIPVVEPLLNPVWVFLFTGESPGSLAFAGGLIVIASIIIRSLYQQRKKKTLVSSQNREAQPPCY
jgi:drug/metabolite transporter (DMT)-like permease